MVYTQIFWVVPRFFKLVQIFCSDFLFQIFCPDFLEHVEIFCPDFLFRFSGPVFLFRFLCVRLSIRHHKCLCVSTINNVVKTLAHTLLSGSACLRSDTRLTFRCRFECTIIIRTQCVLVGGSWRYLSARGLASFECVLRFERIVLTVRWCIVLEGGLNAGVWFVTGLWGWVMGSAQFFWWSQIY